MIAWLAIDGEAGTPITEVGRQSRVARLGELRRDDAALLPAARRRRRHRRRRRARHSVGALGPQPIDHRRRRQRHHDQPARRHASRFRQHRESTERHARPRRRPRVHDADRPAVRRHADVARRYVGRDGRRRLHAVRERPLHARRVADFPQPPQAWRRPQRVALVRSDERLGNEPAARARHGRAHRSRRDASARSAPARLARQGRDADGLDRAVHRPPIAPRSTTVAGDKDFHVLVSPWLDSSGNALVDRIAQSTTAAELARPRPPTRSTTTRRRPTRGPYYFNMLKPRAFFGHDRISARRRRSAAISARRSCCSCCSASSTVLVAAIIVWPLARAGSPADARGALRDDDDAISRVIGFAYMLIQIGLLQRFSVYIGHPTYTLAIVLFSMLLFTGVGSLSPSASRSSTAAGSASCPVARRRGARDRHARHARGPSRAR